MVNEFLDDIERVQALQNMLIAISTGQQAQSSFLKEGSISANRY